MGDAIDTGMASLDPFLARKVDMILMLWTFFGFTTQSPSYFPKAAKNVAFCIRTLKANQWTS